MSADGIASPGRGAELLSFLAAAPGEKPLEQSYTGAVERAGPAHSETIRTVHSSGFIGLVRVAAEAGRM